MKYNQLGKTNLKASEIGLGAEWLEYHNTDEVKEMIDYCEKAGINILDCWMAEPNVRSNIGLAIKNSRDKWIIQGHIGATWQNNQYVRTREMDKVKEGFEDLITRLDTNYINFGMIHFVDEIAEFNNIIEGEFFQYVKDLKNKGTIHHIGLSTHNIDVAKLAANFSEIELIMFSVNLAYDMFHSTGDNSLYFHGEEYSDELAGISPERAELYELCEKNEVPITIMKGYAGGRLLSENDSPFGAALSPVQCIHYALTRPGACSIMVGVNSIKEIDDAIKYETASDEEKDYSSVLVNAPKHSFAGKCTYCGHCAPCPSFIDVAMVNKFYDLATIHDEVPATVKAHYDDLSANASDCIECGDCEKRCPFDVEVIDIMKKADNLFNQ